MAVSPPRYSNEECARHSDEISARDLRPHHARLATTQVSAESTTEMSKARDQKALAG